MSSVQSEQRIETDQKALEYLKDKFDEGEIKGELGEAIWLRIYSASVLFGEYARLSKWVDTEKRKPTKKDANKAGYILAWIGTDSPAVMNYKAAKYSTHWQPLPSKPKKQ